MPIAPRAGAIGQWQNLEIGLEGNAQVAARLRVEIDTGRIGRICLTDVAPQPVFLVKKVVHRNHDAGIPGGPEPGGNIGHDITGGMKPGVCAFIDIPLAAGRTQAPLVILTPDVIG